MFVVGGTLRVSAVRTHILFERLPICHIATLKKFGFSSLLKPVFRTNIGIAVSVQAFQNFTGEWISICDDLLSHF